MKRLRQVLAALAVAVAVAGCGEKQETLGDPTAISGPGVTATPPPWEPEYARLEARIEQLGLPPVGDERYHSHALIHIYNEGLLVETPANIGFDERNEVYSSVHTHDPNGVIHMESSRPHRFTLGDFFTIWGVRFGDRTLGALGDDGEDRVHVFVNGKRIENAPDHVMREGDNISIGYGPAGSFPHEPDTSPLKTVDGKGDDEASCGEGGKDGERPKSCVDQS